MSRAIVKLLLRGLIIVTTAPIVTTAAELTKVNPPRLFDPTPFGYSQTVIVSGASRVVYVSGQGGLDGKGELSPDFDAQVEQAYANLRAALEGVGAPPSQVAKLTLYVVDHDPSKLGALTRHVMATFGTALPAQTLVPVPRLALDGMLFEVEAVAVLN